MAGVGGGGFAMYEVGFLFIGYQYGLLEFLSRRCIIQINKIMATVMLYEGK